MPVDTAETSHIGTCRDGMPVQLSPAGFREVARHEAVAFLEAHPDLLVRGRVARLSVIRGDRFLVFEGGVDGKPFHIFVGEAHGRLNRNAKISIGGVVDEVVLDRILRLLIELSKDNKYKFIDIENTCVIQIRYYNKSKIKSHFKVENYVIDLTDFENLNISSNHMRNIKKLLKTNHDFDISDTDEAIEIHMSLCDMSIDRRLRRGEKKGENHEFQRLKAVIQHGRGRIYRAVAGDKILSSNLVDVLGNVAYYHSGGSSPEGMTSGSSHALMYEIARRLRAEDIGYLALGVSDARREGLTRFKRGFGATEFPYQRLVIDTSGPVSRLLGKLRAALRI